MLGIKDDKSIHPLKKGRELKHGSAFQRKRITVEKEKRGKPKRKKENGVSKEQLASGED